MLFNAYFSSDIINSFEAVDYLESLSNIKLIKVYIVGSSPFMVTNGLTNKLPPAISNVSAQGTHNIVNIYDINLGFFDIYVGHINLDLNHKNYMFVKFENWNTLYTYFKSFELFIMVCIIISILIIKNIHMFFIILGLLYMFYC